jgi:hypothetical protein
VSTITGQSKRANCPSWCETLHAEWDIEPDAHDGPRWSTVRGTDEASVDVATVQDIDGAVVVWLDVEGGSNLTPEQAREVCSALLEAASWVEDHRTA